MDTNSMELNWTSNNMRRRAVQQMQ